MSGTGFKPERMVALRMDKGWSQSELARRASVGQSTVNRLESGETPSSRVASALASALGVDAGYFFGWGDDLEGPSGQLSAPMRSYRAPPAEAETDVLASLGLVPVKEIDLTIGAGGTYIEDSAVSVTVRYFPRQWLREFTDAPPEMLAFARVRGTSMKPTLVDGAILIIDLRRKRIDEQDELWWIVVADIGMVKRIWANPDGSYKIKSDNPNVGPETAHDEEMYAVGRVVASIGKH